VINFNYEVNAISLRENTGLLAVGLRDGSVQCWQKMGDTWKQWQLKWSSTYPNPALQLADCITTGAKGLSPINYRLLKQRGATVDSDPNAKLTSQVGARSGSPLHQNKSSTAQFPQNDDNDNNASYDKNQ